jgi:hypothetical protein
LSPCIALHAALRRKAKVSGASYGRRLAAAADGNTEIYVIYSPNGPIEE